MPITWKNVNNEGGFRAGALLARGAADSFNKAMGNFGGILDESQKIADDNRTNAISNADNDYRDVLAGYGSAADLQAAKDSGELDQQLAGLGPVSRDLRRDGFRTELTDSRTEENVDYSHSQNLSQQAAKPIFEKWQALTLSGDKEGAAAFATENADVLNAAGLTDDVAREGQAEASRRKAEGRSDYTFGRQQAADGREDKRLAGERAADQFATDALVGRDSDDLDAADNMNQMAVDLGVPVNPETGEVDWSQATPEQGAAWEAQVKDSGLLNAQTDTQFYQTSLKQFARENPEASRDTKKRHRENLISDLAERNNILPEDMRKRTVAMGKLDTKYKIANNSLANGQSTDPAADTLQVITSAAAKEDNALAGMMERQGGAIAVNNAVADALQYGVDVDGNQYPVTPAMVESVLNTTRANWTEFGEKTVKTLLQEAVMEKGYQKTFNDYTNHKAETTGLQDSWEGGATRTPGGRAATVSNYQNGLPKPTPVVEQPAPRPIPAPLQPQAAPVAAGPDALFDQLKNQSPVQRRQLYKRMGDSPQLRALEKQIRAHQKAEFKARKQRETEDEEQRLAEFVQNSSQTRRGRR
jgi:hypothetical protein